MDILLINGTHPAAPHISGVRAGRFASELARMGHRCVLICPPMPGMAARDPASIATHDWSRPLIIEEDRHIVGHGRRRLDLTPGLTGLWQVMGRSDIPFAEMVTLDYLYVTNWSLWGDLKLLARTLPAVMRGRGAY